MDQITTADINSNTYFFLSNFNDTLKAGKNAFVVNPTQYIVPNTEITVSAFDSKNNPLPCGKIKPTDAKFGEQTNTGDLYYVVVAETVASGIGRIEITGIGLDAGAYNGAIAYYNGEAYKVSNTQRLPLVQAPSSSPIPKVNVSWTRNVLLDVARKADCEVRFFDSPYIEVTPQIYNAPLFPLASYRLASGSFSSIAILPKNNADGDYDYQFDTPIYQLYWNGGTKFSSSMEGEEIRIKGPSVKNFIYTNQTNNQVPFEGKLNTDFVATIRQVVNDSTILLDIPFSTVSELIDRSNEDSVYSKNNLVDIKGYNANNDYLKQTVYHKKNFYILSIDTGEFEIFHKNISRELPRAAVSGSTYYKKSVLNINCNNLRLLCGTLSAYKVYGRSLNSPESKTLLREGRLESSNLIVSTNFDNGLYNNPGDFYDSGHLSKYWLTKGSATISQSHSILINGATIGHTGNSSQADYVIFKDNTSAGRTSNYINYTLLSKSYWYGKSSAFVNFDVYPTASYQGISNIPILSSYANSQENLISGTTHDSNPIKLQKNTLYQFSLNTKAAPSNTSDSILYVYFLSGNDKIKIGEINSSFNFGANKKYKYTFFSDIERYGTIILVPVSGAWTISNLSLSPYQSIDYSIDSFVVNVPLPVSVKNELYEIEMELYDESGRLSYGKDSYTFIYNKKFLPLKKQVFVDPEGITLVVGGGSGLDLGPYISIDPVTGTITANVFNTN
jgi:hypothetical protein